MILALRDLKNKYKASYFSSNLNLNLIEVSVSDMKMHVFTISQVTLETDSEGKCLIDIVYNYDNVEKGEFETYTLKINYVPEDQYAVTKNFDTIYYFTESITFEDVKDIWTLTEKLIENKITNITNSGYCSKLEYYLDKLDKVYDNISEYKSK